MSDYILSPYLYIFINKKNEYLVYNGLNSSFMKVNKNMFDFLTYAKRDCFVLNDLDTETVKTLRKSLIICTQKEIEMQIDQKKFLRNYHTYQHDVLILTIAPTTACNFNCFYCYEKGIKSKTINNDTAQKMVDFIVERCKKTQNSVSITWYGGEPLLAAMQIDKILEKLREHKIKIVNQGMITNGYFLNTDNIKFIKKNNINFLQITLDGSNPEAHNDRRKNADGSGSWDIILGNIDNALKLYSELNISVRCNTDRSNKDDYQVLKEYLEKRWKNYPNISVYPGILRNHGDQNPDCQYFSDIESSNFIISQGVKNKNLPFFQYCAGSCCATQFNSYLIGPEGELYKCWNDLGRSDRVVGKIDDKTDINKELLLKYITGLSMFDDDMCKSCCLFFCCEGGCQWDRVNKYTDNKKENTCNTQKMNIEKYLEEYYELKKIKNESTTN